MKIKAMIEPGKIALVTGGSSGIGKAIACSLADRGLHVWLMAQRKDLLEAAKREVETHRKSQDQVINAVSTDITDWEQVRKSIKFITEETGTPDILLNIAGAAHPGYAQELDLNIFTWMMAVNYFGTVYVTKELLPAMLNRSSGYIVNTSSIAGFVGTFGYSAYGAAKFAVRGFSDALRSEMKLHNIGVSVVFPPNTQTAGFDYENNFKPHETKALEGNTATMSAEAVAGTILRGIERGRYMIFPGTEGKLLYRVNGLAGGLLTYFMDRIIDGAYKRTTKSKTQEA